MTTDTLLFIYFSSPLILDQDQGSKVFLALSIWQKCPVWDTKTYSRLYYRHKINSPLIRSENFLNFIQNGLIKVRQKPERLQVQRKHELSKVVLAFYLADMSDNGMKTSLWKALKWEILNWDWQSLERIKPDTQGGQQEAFKNPTSVKVHFHYRVILTCDFTRVNKVEAMSGRSRVNVKVEPRSTSTFVRGLHTLPLYYLCALKIGYSGNPPLVKSYMALGFLWISWAWLTLSP